MVVEDCFGARLACNDPVWLSHKCMGTERSDAPGYCDAGLYVE